MKPLAFCAADYDVLGSQGAWIELFDVLPHQSGIGDVQLWVQGGEQSLPDSGNYSDVETGDAQMRTRESRAPVAADQVHGNMLQFSRPQWHFMPTTCNA